MKTLQSDRWVRAFVGDTAVVDSRTPTLIWETNFPVGFYGFARSDFADGALRAAEAPARHGFDFHAPKRDVAQWFDVVVADRVIPHAAWELAEAPGLVILSWDPTLLDRWLEEDVVVRAHPRDPFHRVDALQSRRHVIISVGDDVLADSRHPVVLFETNLPTRYYLPPDDVRFDRLTPSPTTSVCAYKGTADRYWAAPNHDLKALAWSYTAPDVSVAAIAGRIAFYNELVDVTIDGVAQPRAASLFSDREQRPE